MVRCIVKIRYTNDLIYLRYIKDRIHALGPVRYYITQNDPVKMPRFLMMLMVLRCYY